MWEAVVVGGGVHGLAAAFHLQRLGARRLLVLERFAIGHGRGSSHGRSRITRSTYGAAVFSDLVRLARAEEWPRLERACGRRLVVDREGCFFGPRGGQIEEYARVLDDARGDVDDLAIADARRLFPMFRFDAGDRVLRDRTGGIVLAADAVEGLARCVRAAGGEIREGVDVRSVHPGDPIAIDAGGERIEAERAVVAAGPWSARLLPWLRPRLTPLSQTVGYFDVAGAADFPVWAHLGLATFHYGLPDGARPLLKAARHIVEGPPDDPEVEATPDPAALSELDAFLAERIVATCRRIDAETCFYTATATEDYVLDVHPECRRIAIGAGFSGHGFKLAPLSGRILAELALRGTTTVAPFEKERARFAAR
jgi:monomeric sarcosine oxidase